MLLAYGGAGHSLCTLPEMAVFCLRELQTLRGHKPPMEKAVIASRPGCKPLRYVQSKAKRVAILRNGVRIALAGA